MNVEQAKSLIGDTIQFEVKGMWHTATVEDVEEIHKLGHSKATIAFVNNQALTHRDEVEAFDIQDVKKWRKIEGKWSRE